jgi:Secretion system C-terminal sorting domain
MKKILLPFMLLVLISTSRICAQTLMDYVLSVKGDTLVIKDFSDMGQKSNSLTNALNLDTLNVPAGRVYMLKANGYYPLATNITTSTKRPTVIVGADPTRLVNNKNANSAPPVICGSTIEGQGSNTGQLSFANDLTVKNCSIIPAASDATLGWQFFGCSAPNCKVTLENDYFEHTRWIFLTADKPGTKLFWKDCYFVNMSGQACRRNGGVFDGFSNMDTILVENCTHIMAQGSMYKFRNYVYDRIIFNHNTFLNCAGSVFESLGYESNMSITNNIFVNSNVQPFMKYVAGDWGEVDADTLVTGLVNVRNFPDATYPVVPRKILVEGNVIYWDSRFNDMNTTLDTKKVNGYTAWQSQMVTMNTRSQTMFDDNAKYPYLTEGVWYKELPTFTDSKDLLTAQVDSLKAFCVSTVDINSTNVLADWRKVYIGSDYYIYSDWPIPVDLSYTNADLLKGATGGFPVGDLNWFPDKKATWVAQRDAENAAITNALNSGTTTIATAVHEVGNLPGTFQLQQNYPNPFNPSTTISFSLSRAANTSLKVYDMLGREVATLVNGYTPSGSHDVQFKATNLASGFYFYKLTSGSFTEVKKMMLLK